MRFLLLWFESFVNSERCKTSFTPSGYGNSFESFVNSERCKTACHKLRLAYAFESFVNSERCKTINQCELRAERLRALLIQKDVKLTDFF